MFDISSKICHKKKMSTAIRTRIKHGGRLVIPAEYRHKLHLTLTRVQALVQKYNPEHRSLSEELITLRREENEDL